MLARITVVKAVAFSDSADQLMVGAASFPLVVAAQVDGLHTGEKKEQLHVRHLVGETIVLFHSGEGKKCSLLLLLGFSVATFWCVVDYSFHLLINIAKSTTYPRH